MRHARIEQWGRSDSPVHRRHSTAKILAALAILISIATLPAGAWSACAVYLALLAAAVMAAGLPVFALLSTAATVLPFALCFALISAIAGEPARAAMLVARSYLSALTALLLIATTPMADLLAGLELLHAPRFLLQVMQFLYRYLIVLTEEAASMRVAGLSRGGSIGQFALRHAIGAVSVLFARSYERARAIHRAMIARGFEGHMPRFATAAFRISDALFALAAGGIAIAARVTLA